MDIFCHLVRITTHIKVRTRLEPLPHLRPLLEQSMLHINFLSLITTKSHIDLIHHTGFQILLPLDLIQKVFRESAITKEQPILIANLAEDPATRSNTSVCLKFTDDRIQDGAAFAKAVAKRLEAEGVALDIGAYRDAPAGLRIWCGGTVEQSDVAAMLPWLEWAFHAEIEAQTEAA